MMLTICKSKWLWLTLIGINIGMIVRVGIAEKGFDTAMIWSIVAIIITSALWKYQLSINKGEKYD